MEVGPSTRARFLRAFRGRGTVAVLCWLQGCSHCHDYRPVWNMAQRLMAQRHGAKLTMAACEYSAWPNMPPSAHRPYAFPVVKAYRNRELVAELPGAVSLPETLRFLKGLQDGK